VIAPDFSPFDDSVEFEFKTADSAPLILPGKSLSVTAPVACPVPAWTSRTRERAGQDAGPLE